MATSKRFESLIGNNRVFYQNFRLKFERYWWDEVTHDHQGVAGKLSWLFAKGPKTIY